MDEVLEKLETTVISQNEKSKFEDLYKSTGRLENQEQRRKDLLDVQKENRNSRLDGFRGILDLVQAVEEHNIFRSYNRVRYRPNIYVAGFNKASLTYNNVLMLSEWMMEKPEDFEENWYVVPCPKGVRMLLVANNGITKCFTKQGHFRFECRTALPGGNPCESKSKKHACCVLDGFYQEKNNTFYILDVLAWTNTPMTDGETEFRHYWLTTKMDDIPEVKYLNKKNEMIFSILPYTPCSSEEFNKFMSKYPAFECNFPSLDGLLFYHKRAHYISGETPLVGWLYPFMVPEILGEDVQVNNSYLLEKPQNYTNQADFITQFEQKYAKRNKHRSRRNSCMSASEMDTTPQETVDKENEDNDKNLVNMESVTQMSNVADLYDDKKEKAEGESVIDES